jgi:ketosteroid isomerase-like protein
VKKIAPQHKIDRELADANIDVVRRLFALVEERGNAKDLAARWPVYEAVYGPEVTIHEAPSLPYGGSYTGATALAGHAQAFNRAWEGLQDVHERRLEPQFFADVDRVAVLWRQRGHNPETGERIDLPAVSIYELRDGRIIDSRMFHFDAAAVAGFLQRAGRQGSLAMR